MSKVNVFDTFGGQAHMADTMGAGPYIDLMDLYEIFG